MSNVELDIQEILEPLPAFRWEDFLKHVPPTGTRNGPQVMHFSTGNKPYINDPEACQFFDKYLKNAVEIKSDAEAMRFASDSVTIKGAYIELGVCTGRTINLLAGLNPHSVVFGFDSFEGLSGDWTRTDFLIGQGTFALKDSNTVPPVLENVRLYKGLFADTLPRFVMQYLKDTPIALLHIDCDIYAATKDGFDALKNNIVPGTVIIFDELYNYGGYQHHEYKALNEFLAQTGYSAEYIGFNSWHEQVVMRIK